MNAYFLLCLFYTIDFVISSDCSLGASTCECKYDGKTYALKESATGQKVPDDIRGYDFYLEPCGHHEAVSSSCNSVPDTHVIGCQVNGGDNSQYNIASNDINWVFVTGNPEDNNVVFQYNYTTQDPFNNPTNRVTYVHVKCGSGYSLTFDTENPKLNYHFTAVSEAFCTDSDSGLSFGSVLLLLLFLAIIIYISGGFLFNTFVRHARGVERFPHIEFWKDLPSLIIDGVKFTFRGCKGESTYQAI